MSIFAEAVFENGVLRPKHPLGLDEGVEVQLTIRPTRTPAREKAAPAEDPLDAVLGICDEGPDLSLAEHHDELLYGPIRVEDADPT